MKKLSLPSFALGIGLALSVAVVAQSTSTSSSTSKSQGGSAWSQSSGSASARGGGSASGQSNRGGGNINLLSGDVFLVTWETAGPLRPAALEAHQAFIKNFAMRAGILLEGPRKDGNGRIAMMQTNPETLRRIVAESPLVKSNLAKPSAVAWTIEHSFLYAPGQTSSVSIGGR